MDLQTYWIRKTKFSRTLISFNLGSSSAPRNRHIWRHFWILRGWTDTWGSNHKSSVQIIQPNVQPRSFNDSKVFELLSFWNYFTSNFKFLALILNLDLQIYCVRKIRDFQELEFSLTLVVHPSKAISIFECILRWKAGCRSLKEYTEIDCWNYWIKFILRFKRFLTINKYQFYS